MSSAKIHSTAIVDSASQLGTDVSIGPYALIGADVAIGERSTIQSHVVIEGAVTIGSGNDNVIREYCTIHRGSPDGSATTIGNKNFLMVGAHIGHNCQIGNNVIIAINCLLAGHVVVDDHAFLGGGSTFHQHMHVGRLVMVQGSSAFGKDLPPFTLAAERNAIFGLNVVGLKRGGFTAKERDEIKAAFKLIYMSGLNISQALHKAASMKLGPAAREFVDFVANAKKRGICPYRHHEGHEDHED